MKDLFPSLYEVKRLEEVVLFTVGLMANPKPLVNHVYELWNERLRAILRSQEPDTNAKENLKRSGRDINKLSLLSSLYTECTVPLPGTSLHNQHVNIHHGVLESRTYPASRLYEFNRIVEVTGNPVEFKVETEEEIPECIVALVKPYCNIAGRLLDLCRIISHKQPITDLYVDELKCEVQRADVFNMSTDVCSVRVYNSSLPKFTLDHLCKQLANSSTLCRIDFSGTSLKSVKSLRFSGLPSLTHLDLKNTDISQIHLYGLTCMLKQRTSPRLCQLNLGANDLFRFEDDLDLLLKKAVNHHQSELQLGLENNKLPTEFLQKWKQQTEGTRFMFVFETK